MQVDMHFYGTYALARAAGLLVQDAKTLAYAAQFVDDSNHQDSQNHPDGGLLYGIATAHHPKDCAINARIEPYEHRRVWVGRLCRLIARLFNLGREYEQRRVWVPFHFLPGGVGETQEERLLCVKDSAIAREMITHHCDKVCAEKPAFGLELLGIAAHVYLDTFAHYGFSGVSSDYNDVDTDSISLIDVKDKEIKNYIENKIVAFVVKHTTRSFAGLLLEKGAKNLGHGGTFTYPDRPYLHWRVEFVRPRPDNGSVDRDNPRTYLEGCEKLHRCLSDFTHRYYHDNPDTAPQPFEQFKGKVDEILRFEGRKEDRIEKWRTAIAKSDLYPAEDGEVKDIRYSHKDWEREKDKFHELKTSTLGTETHVYRFHQAAALHRYYVLKELLPAHGIAVY